MDTLRAKREPYGEILEDLLRERFLEVSGFDKAATLSKYAKESGAFSMVGVVDESRVPTRDRFVAVLRRPMRVKRELKDYIIFDIL